VLVVSCALFAILIANSPWSEAWNHVWHTELALRVGDVTIAKSVAHWINDGLMVLFFYFVGLEIKHEVLDGQLRTFRQAVLPVAAAAGGMFLPAAVFAIVVAAHGDAASARGWGIPMATDIAFALGVLALLGRRVPPSLKVFLATLAIVDDLGAVLVIAVFYTAEISWAHLGVGVLVLLVSYACNRVGVRRTWPYVVLGLALWILFLGSGAHATIAGVALALTVPARRALDEREFTRRGRLLLDEFDRVGEPDPLTNAQQLEVVQELQRHASDVQAPLQRMKHALHPLIAHLIVPLFALANAGVDLRGDLGETLVHPAAHGVFLGLVLGKPAGVLLATWAARRAFGSPLPDRTTWRHVHGVAWLAGIGFTMSLFIDSLAFASAPSAFRRVEDRDSRRVAARRRDRLLRAARRPGGRAAAGGRRRRRCGGARVSRVDAARRGVGQRFVGHARGDRDRGAAQRRACVRREAAGGEGRSCRGDGRAGPRAVQTCSRPAVGADVHDLVLPRVLHRRHPAPLHVCDAQPLAARNAGFSVKLGSISVTGELEVCILHLSSASSCVKRTAGCSRSQLTCSRW
jgi:Na+:H+ antiporter, NhaA family